jgi:hypothetical protein
MDENNASLPRLAVSSDAARPTQCNRPGNLLTELVLDAASPQRLQHSESVEKAASENEQLFWGPHLMS